jgi:acetyl esterase/lipase
MKKINLFFVIVGVLYLQNIKAQMPYKKIEPSKAQAQKMTVLSEFTAFKIPVYLHDVVYAHANDMDLHLQIVMPEYPSRDIKLPCIIYIQGSAWFQQPRFTKITMFTELCKRGYVFASVEYRPSPVASFPAQIQDVKTAVRFMRKNAEKYGVDVNNFFIWGDSSGGNMALLACLTQDQPSLDTEEYSTGSVAVNACVAYYPVTDVLRMQEFAPDYMDHISANSPTGILFGGIPVMENPDKVKTASPITYVSREKASSTAPILIMTGNQDRVVPFEQSVIMADRLEEFGYDYTFYKIEGGDHGSWEFWSLDAFNIIDNFFKRNIKHN